MGSINYLLSREARRAFSKFSSVIRFSLFVSDSLLPDNILSISMPTHMLIFDVKVEFAYQLLEQVDHI